MLAERLDYLMKLTNTRNAELAKALNFDPSYISRMRSGKRGLPSHHPFIDPAARFFAKQVTEDYQKQSLSDMILDGRVWPEDPDTARVILSTWLDDEEGIGFNDSISRFLDRLSKTTSLDPTEYYPDTDPFTGSADPALKDKTYVTFYHGNEGKREAVLEMLRSMAVSGRSDVFLCHTDESLDWVSENHYFTAKWYALLAQYIRGGGRIRIIHTISRDLGELLNAIDRWLPLYVTGAVEPWYCPRTRDGIFHRSLFVMPGMAALTSNSIGPRSNDSLCMFTRDPEALLAFEKEFYDLLALCRPLAEVRHITGLEELPADLSEYRYRFEESGVLPPNVRLYADEKKGTAVIHTAEPYLILTSNESHLTRLFIDYWMLHHE